MIDYFHHHLGGKLFLSYLGVILAGVAVLAFRHVRIDTEARKVTVDDRPVELTAIEFDLLKALAGSHGRVLTREQLLESVWGGTYFGEMRVVDVHLGHVRQKLGSGEIITTVRGVGYRFEDQPL
jgi:two-component system, OmpR family, alkaline phosphatase synthesis response regulator PhoP